MPVGEKLEIIAARWDDARGEGERARCLLDAARLLAPSELFASLGSFYRQADVAQQAAILRALPLLPDPARFIALALDGCRSSLSPVFEAIACENPFPGDWFADHAFNHMVVRALDVGIALSRIQGVAARWNSELARMAQTLAQERLARSTTVPEDVKLLLEA